MQMKAQNQAMQKALEAYEAFYNLPAGTATSADVQQNIKYWTGSAEEKKAAVVTKKSAAKKIPANEFMIALYFENLDKRVTFGDLYKHFYGYNYKAQSAVFSDTDGVMTFYTPEDAQIALDDFDGTRFFKRNLEISLISLEEYNDFCKGKSINRIFVEDVEQVEVIKKVPTAFVASKADKIAKVPKGRHVIDAAATKRDAKQRATNAWTHVKFIPASMKGWNYEIDNLDGDKSFGIQGNETMAWSAKFDMREYNQFLIESGDCTYQRESRTEVTHGNRAVYGIRQLQKDYLQDQFLWDIKQLKKRGGANIYMRQKFQRGGETPAPEIPACLRVTCDPYATKDLTSKNLKQAFSDKKKVSGLDSQSEASTHCSAVSKGRKVTF